jgi:hypothetical protein
MEKELATCNAMMNWLAQQIQLKKNSSAMWIIAKARIT